VTDISITMCKKFQDLH